MKSLENLSEEMNGTILEAVAHFAMSVEDYRRTKKGNFKHPLSDLILLVVLCYLDGQIYYKDCIAFAERNLGRLQSTYGILKNGVLSVSTLCRMSQCVEHEMMSDMLQGFANRFADQLNDQEIRVISVDGKAPRGTINENGRNPDIISIYDVGPE